MTQEQKQDYTRKITQANKTQLITILYEMVLDYLKDAREAYDMTDVAEYDLQLTHAQNCIDELIHSLDLQYEIARNLLQLYLYSKRELIAATARQDKEYIRHAETVFEGLHKTYQQLEKMDTDLPVLTNTQTVYAGLTYGRSDLNESVADPVMNRGFQA
ncbi:MAG: flagellar protein FliS [Butyrivibrio sp.]|jgi:flagellar protein FliS|nr:flagellar protein FliS [Butyrivibrio sp.]